MKNLLFIVSTAIVLAFFSCEKEDCSLCINAKIEQFKKDAPKSDFNYSMKIHESAKGTILFFQDEKGDFALNSQCDTIASMSECCRSICDCITPEEFYLDKKMLWKE